MCCVIHIFTLCICIAACNYINAELRVHLIKRANARLFFLLHCCGDVKLNMESRVRYCAPFFPFASLVRLNFPNYYQLLFHIYYYVNLPFTNVCNRTFFNHYTQSAAINSCLFIFSLHALGLLHKIGIISIKLINNCIYINAYYISRVYN